MEDSAEHMWGSGEESRRARLPNLKSICEYGAYTMTVSVYGLGYVGLPTAIAISMAGHSVHGIDIDERKIADLERGKSAVNDGFVQSNLSKLSIQLSTSPVPSDAHVICVPTPVDNRYYADLTAVESATKSVAGVLREGDLVIVESTIYPGVCEDVVAPILRKAGVQYSLAHCPERINPGDTTWTVQNIPRVLGGADDVSTDKAKELYNSFLESEVTVVGSIRAAEATKILENTFRDINIAFVNEMAKSFARLSIDIHDVIRAAATKPFGYMPFFPGAGVGGHCIAVDPYYMIARGKEAGFDHEFLRLARKINESMPEYAVEVLGKALNEVALPLRRTSVALLGIAYKPGVADDRESPAVEILKLLTAYGCDLRVYDPYLPDRSTVATLDEALTGADAVLLATAHPEFLEAVGQMTDAKVVVDGRNSLDRQILENAGVVYRGIGR
jgi:nucleotide sugar dehydrogenase